MTEPHNRRPLDQKACVLALIIGFPALISAFGLGAMETWRWIQPNSPLFVAPMTASLADAIASDNFYAAYTFIRAGQDPNEAMTVRHPVLTDGRQVQISPLLWAVATQSERAVATLLAVGARLDADAEHDAVCLAEQLNRPDIVELLLLTNKDGPSDPCPPRKPDSAVLFSTSR